MRMTNEEALDELNVIYERLSHPEDCEQGVYSFRDGDYLEALDMAIKALEQEPCEDCISRQEAISAIQDEYYADATGIDIVDIIAHLPSVQPTRPTARWERFMDYNKCSKCGEMVKFYRNYKYCPGCGRRMQSEGLQREDS